MVRFSVELGQRDSEVFADLPHDFFAPDEDLVGEYPSPVFGCEYEVGVQV